MNSKKNRKKSFKAQKSKTISKSNSVPQNPSSERKWRNMFKSAWVLVGAPVLVCLIWFGILEFRDSLETPAEKYEKENFVSGELIPPQLKSTSSGSYTQYLNSENRMYFKNLPITDGDNSYDTLPYYERFPTIEGIDYMDYVYPDNTINISVGDKVYKYSIDTLMQGVNVFSKNCQTCVDKEIFVGIKNQKLFVNVEFKDLQNNETIGIIDFNRWKLYKPNLLTFKSNSRSLEVMDKKNNIVFSIGYTFIPANSHLNISGYFMDNKSVVVVANDLERVILTYPCYDKSNAGYRDSATKELAKVKSIFDSRKITYVN